MEPAAAPRGPDLDTPALAARQPWPLTAFKAVGLAAAAALAAALGVTLVGASRTPLAGVAIFGGCLAGYLAADLLSGTVHWFCDTFFSESTPLIGRRVIQPFRDHHTRPQEITRYRLLEQDGSNYIALVPLLWMVRGWPPRGIFDLLAQSALLGLALGSLGTNLFHKWAHSTDVPAPVRWLQRRRLILSPEAHAVHHGSYDGGYCVTSGWMNPMLDRVRFFPRLELLVRRMQPRRRCSTGNLR